MEKKTIDFEKAFERLELILEKLNSGTTSLEESLKLYEEADKLILYCHGKLTQAERTIEVLMKNREDQLLLQNNGPKTEPLQNMQ